MKNALVVKTCLLVSLIAMTAVVARALPPSTQLEVDLKYTRTVNSKSRLGPDNYEHTQLLFKLAAKFETLADVVAPREFERWPQYVQVHSDGPLTGSASLDASVEVDKPTGIDAPKRTEHHYSTGSKPVKLEDLQLNVKSAFPVNREQTMAEISFSLPMRGASSGVPAGLAGEAAVSAVKFSPVSVRDGNGLQCPVVFNLLPIAGPPPDGGKGGKSEARAYNMIMALSWNGAGTLSQGAPCVGWVGAQTTKGPDGLPIFMIDQTKKWTEEGGEITDTLVVTIRPVPITLKVREIPGEMDEQTKAVYIADIVRNAKKILGSTKKAADGYVPVLVYLETKYPDLSAGAREMIASDAITSLIEKRLLKEDDSDE